MRSIIDSSSVRIRSCALRLALGSAPLVAFATPALTQIDLGGPTNVPVSSAPRASETADLDGDGDLDLVVSADGPERLEILLNLGAANFVPGTPVPLPAGSRPCTPVAADLDGDGDLDLAVTLESPGRIELFTQTAAGFQAAGSIPVSPQAHRLAAGDLDGDGDFDLAATSLGASAVTVALNQGGFSFVASQHAVPQSVREIVIAELTGDALLDVAVTSISSDVITILASQGNGGFVPLPVSLGGLVGHTLAAGDVDGDGDRDLVTSGGGSFSYLIVAENKGAGVFEVGDYVPLMGGGIGVARLADLDADGDLDFALASALTGELVTAENDGAGTFSSVQGLSAGQVLTHLDGGDLNGDGSADLVVTLNHDDALAVFLNTASGVACDVTAYCSAKVNSLGQVAALGAANAPSFMTQGFSVHMTNALPNKTTLAFFGTNGQANLPLFGGTLCVAPPLVRLPVRVTTAAGSASYSIPITADMVGTTRNFQFFYRDPAHLDGTGFGLSDGLEVTFCD